MGVDILDLGTFVYTMKRQLNQAELATTKILNPECHYSYGNNKFFD